MEFQVRDPALLQSLKPGQKIAFEFVEDKPGEYAIVRVQPAAAKAGAGVHKGH